MAAAKNYLSLLFLTVVYCTVAWLMVFWLVFHHKDRIHRAPTVLVLNLLFMIKRGWCGPMRSSGSKMH